MMEDTYYQLEEALVQGFQTPEEYQAYKELKEHYEEVTGDYSFSIRELTSQLEISLQNHRGVDFEEHEKEEYQTKKAEYDVLAPLIETETDLDIIDQALRQFHEKGKEKQEQLSFELD